MGEDKKKSAVKKKGGKGKTKKEAKEESKSKRDYKEEKKKDEEEDEKEEKEPATKAPTDPRMEKRKALVQSWISRALDMGIDKLRAEFRALAKYTSPEMTVTAFKANHPQKKNRYQDVPCQDQHRVVLKFPGLDLDYVHANYVATPMSDKRFICTQGPLDHTVDEFWAMTVQEESDSIIMLSQCIETGKNKCSQYWPDKVGEERKYVNGSISVTNKEMRKFMPDEPNLIVSVLQVKTADVDREVRHFQWQDWPDRGVPPCKLTAMELLSSVRGSKHPLIIHCSAGIGRTGSIVAIEYILERIMSLQDCASMGDLLKELRNQRAYSIGPLIAHPERLGQSQIQYLYVHRIIMCYFLEKHRAMYESFFTDDFAAKYKKFVEDYNTATGV